MTTQRRTLFSLILETGFLLAACGSLYWSGRIAERLTHIERALAAIELRLRTVDTVEARLQTVEARLDQCQCRRLHSEGF